MLGALGNGAAQSSSIAQGEAQLWSFAVEAPLTGTDPLPDVTLTFVLQLDLGLCSLQVTDPSGTSTLGSGSYGDDGVLYSNRSSNGSSTSSISSGPVLYGTYSVNVYSVADSFYTLTASLSRRQQLIAGDAGNRVGGLTDNSSSLLGDSFVYADFVVDTAGPVQLTVSATMDTQALVQAGVALSGVQLPLVYWSAVADPPAWSPASATWSTAASLSSYYSFGVGSSQLTQTDASPSPAGLLYSVVSTYSNCITPPCLYSFLIAPQQSLPALALLTLTLVNLSAPYDPALDYALTTDQSQPLSNVSISTSLLPLSTNAVHYYQFSVLDAQVSLLLTLYTPDPDTNVLLLLSQTSELPDTATFQWQAASASASSSTRALAVTSADPFFSPSGPSSLTRSMEGLWQLTVYAQLGGRYALQLNLSDESDYSAPLIPTGVQVTGVLQARQLVQYRYLPPAGYDGQRMELTFTTTNCSLYASNFYPSPGPLTGLQNNVAMAQLEFTSQLPTINTILSIGSPVNLDGVYYLGLYRAFATSAPYSISVSVNAYVALVLDVPIESDAPLLPGQGRLFRFVQPGFSSLALQLALDTPVPGQYGSVYIRVWAFDTPTSNGFYDYQPPSPPCQACRAATFSLTGGPDTHPTLSQQLQYSCAAAYQCVWELGVFAPATQALSNFTLLLSEPSITAVWMPLAVGLWTPVTQDSSRLSFALSSYVTVNLTLSTSSDSAPLVLSLTRRPLSSSPITRDVPDFLLQLDPAQTLSVSLVFDPSNPRFATDQSNVGSPFLSSYYLTLSSVSSYLFSASLLLVTSADSSPIAAVAPLALQLMQSVEQSVQLSDSLMLLYYSCQVPADYAASTADFFFTAQLVESPGIPIYPTFSLWWSTTQPLPSPITNDFQGSLFIRAAAVVQAFALNNSNALTAGQQLFVGVGYADGSSADSLRRLSVQCAAVPRRRLTASAGTGSLGAAPAGFAAVVDLVIPPRSSTLYISFIAGVTVANDTGTAAMTHTLGPLFVCDTSLSASAERYNTLPDLSYVLDPDALQPAAAGGSPYYLLGSFAEFTAERCDQPSLGCVFHFLVFFPQPTVDWQFTVSALITAPSASLSSLTSAPLTPNSSTGPLTLPRGSVQLFQFTTPAQVLGSAQLVFTLSQSNTSQPLALFASNTPALAFADPLPYNNRQLAPDGLHPRLNALSYGSAGQLPLSIDSTALTQQQGTPLYALWQLAVVSSSSVDVAFTLSAEVSGSPAVILVDGSLAVDGSGPRSASNLTDAVYSVQVPASYTPSADLTVTVFCAGGVVSLQLYNAFPSLGAESVDYFPRSSFVLVRSRDGASLPLRTISSFAVQPGSTLYALVSAGPIAYGRAPFSIYASQRPRTALALGQVASGQLAVGDVQTFTFSLSAVRSGSSWSTSASFLAAASALSCAQPDGLWLAVTLADSYATAAFNPFALSRSSITGSFSGGRQQLVTVSDVCSLPQCTWAATLLAQSSCSYTFAFTALTPPAPLIPGLRSQPRYLQADRSDWFSFSLPHPGMTAVISLTPVDAELDLFISPQDAHPDLRSSLLSSINSTAGTAQSLVISPSLGSVNRTWYASAFAVQPGCYTIVVEVKDGGAPPLPFTSDDLVTGQLAAGGSAYFVFSVGELSGATDLSFVLSGKSGAEQPSLYTTPSYTKPGPVNGSLPSFLPYESIAAAPTANGLHQVLFTSASSSALFIPLQAQSSWYAAVYSRSGGPFQLSASLQPRLTLQPTQSVSFQRVTTGSVQYVQYSFSAISRPGQSALLALTGLSSPISSLPWVYTADPSISGQLDPVLSSPSSYTSSMQLGAGSTPSSNALTSVLTADCSAWPATSLCQYESLVYAAQTMDGYALAVTVINEGDQQRLSPGSPIAQWLDAGAFLFFSFDLDADALSFTLSLTTLTADGNADLCVSAATTHPYLANASSCQWAAYADPLFAGQYTDEVVVNSTAAQGLRGRYYASVFAQRAANFSMTLTAVLAERGAPSSGASVAVIAVLSTCLPATFVLLICCVVRRYQRVTARAEKRNAQWLEASITDSEGEGWTAGDIQLAAAS